MQYDYQRLCDIHLAAFRKVHATHPKGTCVGQNWRIEITPEGHAELVTPYEVKVNEAWEPRQIRTWL